LLSIIIHNLIDNAAKYTKKGDISIYMRKRGDGKSELIISNTGSQLPEEVISMINHSGLQNESSAANQRTSGIGLLIVKEIAGLIDVNIHVTQTDKTCFHLVFDN
jgi:signal transduction histidine kinase